MLENEHQGGCYCGSVRYVAMGEPRGGASLCHCSDCRRHAGAPAVAWVTFPAAQVRILTGRLNEHASSERVRWRFCASCGTGLFLVNLAASHEIDVQTATLDNPSTFPPAAHEQIAERIDWMATAHELPVHWRFPQVEPHTKSTGRTSE